MENYVIITDSTNDESGWDYRSFQNEVNKFLKENPGYTPCGGITATKVSSGFGMYYKLAQPMIKKAL